MFFTSEEIKAINLDEYVENLKKRCISLQKNCTVDTLAYMEPVFDYYYNNKPKTMKEKAGMLDFIQLKYGDLYSRCWFTVKLPLPDINLQA